MTLLNDLNNMVDEIKNKTRTTELRDKIKKI